MKYISLVGDFVLSVALFLEQGSRIPSFLYALGYRLTGSIYFYSLQDSLLVLKTMAWFHRQGLA